MLNLKRLYNKIYNLYVRSSSSRYISYLRNKGMKIGDNLDIFGGVKTILIDETRPSLVSIGSNCSINKNFILLTHDWVCALFKNKYNDFLNSSGKVLIGNNVHFGMNCVVLKGVTIGDNCFVAAGSVVTKSMPANSLIGGEPAKVLCSIDEYYEKRKVLCEQEAFEYARSIKERYAREPQPIDFWEEFHLFADAENIDDYPMIPIKRQLGSAYDTYLKNHKKKYNGFDEFIKAVNK